MFKLIGIVEEAGSGVDVLMKGWTSNFFCLPLLTEDIMRHKVIWELPYLAMMDRNVMYAQQEFLGYEKYARLTAEEKIMLMMIPADRFVSNQDLRLYMPGLHPVDLGKRLTHLRDEGYLCSKGRSSATKYGLVDKLAAQIRVLSASRNSGLNASGNSGLNGKGSDNSTVTRTMQELNLPEDLRRAVEEYRRKARQARHVTDALVWRLCQGRSISLMQLSILMNRETHSLRRDVVSPMVRHGQLKYTKPRENDPEQAYTAVLSDDESQDVGRC